MKRQEEEASCDGYQLIKQALLLPDSSHSYINTTSSTNLLDLFDLDSIQCGNEKCYFASKENSTWGYLLTSEVYLNGDGVKQYDSFRLAHLSHYYGEYLAQSYGSAGVRTLEGPSPPIPVDIEPSSRTESLLEQYTSSQNRTNFGRNNLLIMVHSAPQENFYFKKIQQGWNPSVPRNIAWHVLHTYEDKFLKNEQQTPNVTANLLAFFETLQGEVQVTMDVMKQEPLLSKDFQFLLDTNGRLYYMDLDRVFLAAWAHESIEQAYCVSILTLQTLYEWTRYCQELVRHLATLNEMNDNEIFEKVVDDGMNNPQWERDETEVCTNYNARGLYQADEAEQMRDLKYVLRHHYYFPERDDHGRSWCRSEAQSLYETRFWQHSSENSPDSLEQGMIVDLLQRVLQSKSRSS